MSLNKAITYGKEKRKAYRGAKSVDRSCRNHGSCPQCAHNRQVDKRRGDTAKEGLEAYYNQHCPLPGKG